MKNLPIPETNFGLQVALRALGCRLKDIGEARAAIVLPMHGWTNWGAKTFEFPLDTFRRLYCAHMQSLQDLHQYLVHTLARVDREPDWQKVEAAIAQHHDTDEALVQRLESQGCVIRREAGKASRVRIPLYHVAGTDKRKPAWLTISDIREMFGFAMSEDTALVELLRRGGAMDGEQGLASSQ